jgi:hypothetical protein
MRSLTTGLRLGVRFALTGGRSGWLRLLLSALGIAAGITMLLLVASIPTIDRAQGERSKDRHHLEPDPPLAAADDTLLVEERPTSYRNDTIQGLALQPEGPRAAPPPGLDTVPEPGTMVVSPALQDLLDGPDGALLRERFPFEITGEISDIGLAHPHELLFYVGADDLPDPDPDPASTRRIVRIDHFGASWSAVAWSERLPPQAYVVLMVGMAMVLAPVVAFIATAVRFGGEQQERRLAALRLLGADIRTVRYAAAGETLVAVAPGIAAGFGLFALLRPLVVHFRLGSAGIFPADMWPDPVLAAGAFAVVPVLAVVVTVTALRGVSIEPLGVTRNATPRPRRLWWRLAPPVLGLVLVTVFGSRVATSSAADAAIIIGCLLLLLGGALLLPWVVELMVRRAGGGSVAWQLAARRTQLSGGSATRPMSAAIAAIAGVIAVQALIASTSTAPPDPTTGGSGIYADLDVPLDDVESVAAAVEAVAATPGVAAATGVTVAPALPVVPDGVDATERGVNVIVADCPALAELVDLDTCRAGSVFVVDSSDWAEDTPRAGDRLDLAVGSDGTTTASPDQWAIPAEAVTVPLRGGVMPVVRQSYWDRSVLATPEALDPARLSRPSVWVGVTTVTSGTDRDEIEHLRNTASALSPTAVAFQVEWESSDETMTGQINSMMTVGMVIMLLFVVASLLVSTAEQLRERRRHLAVLAAFGVQRGTVARSVAYQSAVPVVAGLTIATGTGLLLGWALLQGSEDPLQLDPLDVLKVVGAAAGTVAAITAISLPLLWRLMRADNLRFE